MARSNAGSWSELSDAAVILRIQSILINAAKGQRGVADDRQYNVLRGEFRKRSLVTPRLVSTHPTVNSFSAFITGISDRTEREEMVRRDFMPALSGVREPNTQTDSSAWTGKQSVSKQAQIVRRIGPQVITAIDTLLSEQEKRHHNGSPVEPAEEDAIKQLKELRATVDELIRLAEADQPIATKSKRLAKIAARALNTFTENLREDAQAVHVAGSAVAVTAVAYALSHSLLGLSEIPATLFGTAALTGFGAQRVKG